MQAFKQFSPASKQQQPTLDIGKMDFCTDKVVTSQQTEAAKTEQHFQQFKKIYLTAYLLDSQKRRLSVIAEELSQNLQKIQECYLQFLRDTKVGNCNQVDKSKRSQENTVKRCRRKADDISRQWECQEQFCGRKYGAHASLLQHVKLKHPTVYEKYCSNF